MSYITERPHLFERELRYRARAAEAQRLGEQTQDPEFKLAYLMLAHEWALLADDSALPKA